MNLLFESYMTKTATRLPHLILSERARDAQPYLSLNLTLPYEINQFQLIYVPPVILSVFLETSTIIKPLKIV